MTWQQIKEETKQGFIRDFKRCKNRKIDTIKLVKLYLHDIKAINIHIANNDKCNCIEF